MGNLFKTALLLGVLTSVLVLLGGALGGQHGMLLGLIMAAVMNFGAYWFSDKMALAMSGAQPVDESQAPELYRMVRNLATRAQLPMPRIFMIPRTPRTPSRPGGTPSTRRWRSPRASPASSIATSSRASWPTSSPTSRTETR